MRRSKKGKSPRRRRSKLKKRSIGKKRGRLKKLKKRLKKLRRVKYRKRSLRKRINSGSSRGRYLKKSWRIPLRLRLPWFLQILHILKRLGQFNHPLNMKKSNRPKLLVCLSLKFTERMSK